MANRLYREKSPYLLQHGENPVDWYPWCEEAFQKAEQEDKPVFLSIGYSTCHWCHVMAHESFEDQEVAEILNREFVSIKVDREERPDIDSVYMSVCQAVTGSGGWPLTIIMTPQQKPFFAGTYFPKKGAYEKMGLTELLERVAFLWKENREDLIRAGNEITAAINQSGAGSGHEPNRKLVERAASQLVRIFDVKWGGFGQAPKFPTPHNLLFLMRYASTMRERGIMKIAQITLEDMARGGIHDHIGGGFSRYSTDEMWLVPHFEKMLYDNALLLMAYVKAYQHTKREMFADVAHRTAQYILRELTSQEGGCYCGQDADSDGVEGKYYVFTPNEEKQILGESDGEAFCRLYNITDAGNFEGKSIPNRIGAMADGWELNDPRLKKLYDYRLNRTSLHKDDKILLSWNAWALIGLVQAGAALSERKYLDAAIRIHQFIETKMTDANDRLYLRYRDGEAANAGQLDDYAIYALALLELYRNTFETEYLEKAIHLAEKMTELFEDKDHGGYFMTASDSELLIARPKETYDGAIPSGNSVAGMVLQRLSYLTGERKWQEAAQRQMQFLADSISDYPTSSCFGVLSMMDALYPCRELVCATKYGIPSDLNEWLKGHPADDLQILLKTSENAELLSRCAPFTADYPVPDQGVTYYLCEDGVCKSPVDDFSQLNL
ncbi:MAG: thioredoxin domain-containing protein [Bacteroidales bacterium]|nr:thioredoxin domain-containing protein [Bacteroidales bacterium]